MANLYLTPGENLTGLTFGGNVFGSTGNEIVTYAAGVNGITFDQNVEQVRFSEATSAFTYQQAGNTLLVFRGGTQVASIALQGDANGTLISFTNGTVEAKLVAGSPPTITLGGATVPAAAPNTVIPVVIDGSSGTGAVTLNLTVNQDNLTGTAGVDKFVSGASQDGNGTLIQTLQDVDVINGGEGADSIDITITGSKNATVTPTLTSIETVGVRFVEGAASTLNLSNSTGVTAVNVAKSTQAGTVAGVGAAALAVADQKAAVTFNGSTATALTLSATNVGEAGTQVKVAVDSAKADTATSLALTVQDAHINLDSVDNDAYKTVSIAATGKNTVALTDVAAVAETLTVTGAGSVDVTTALTALKSLTAGDGGLTATAGNTIQTVTTGAGVDTLTLGAAALKSVATGAGDDVVTINGALLATATADLGAGNDSLTLDTAITKGAVLTGGDGKDTLSLTAALAEAVTGSKDQSAAVKGFEVLSVGVPAAAATIDVSAIEGINYVKSAGTGAAGQTETSTVTVAGLNSGQSVTVGGLTVTATTTALTAADVEAAILAGKTTGAAVVSGTLTGFTAENDAGNVAGTVVFKSTTAGPVADITVSGGTVGNAAAPVIAETTKGVAATTNEVQSITFGALQAGQSVTVHGRTITATNAALTAAQVEAAFINGVTAGAAVVSGALISGTVSEAGGVGDGVAQITLSQADEALVASSGTGPAAAAAPGVTTVQGVLGQGLTLNNFASGGTLELTGVATADITANVKNAVAGTADVFNVVLNGAANLVNTGKIVVADVETINITTTDSNTKADPAAASTINLSAAGATAITVTGNHGVNFTGSTLTKVASLDASGVVATDAKTAGTVGAVTFTSVVDAALTIKTGNGNDVINAQSSSKGATITTGLGDDTVTGSTGADTIGLGDGNDTVNSSAGIDTITLGAGNDAYVLLNTTHSTINARDVISDFQANTVGQGTGGAATSAGAVVAAASRNGDVINIDAVTGLNTIRFSVLTNAADATTFVANGQNDGVGNVNAALDSSTGNLYIDVDDNGVADSVIQLTGITTLTSAAFVIA